MEFQEVPTHLERALVAELEFRRAEERPVPPQPRTYAYSGGYRECDLWMVLAAERPEIEELDIDEMALARFRYGSERARDLWNWFDAAGRRADPSFRLERGETPVEITTGTAVPWEPEKSEPGEKIIGGRAEGIVHYSTGLKVAHEFKSGNAARGYTSIEKTLDSIYGRRAFGQLLTYMTSMDLPAGVLIADTYPLPTILPVSWEDEWARDLYSEFERKARLAHRVLIGKEDRPPPTKDRSLCARCPHFRNGCEPAEWDAGAGAEVLAPQDEQKALRRKELEDAYREYKRIDDYLKSKHRGKDAVIGSRVIITGKAIPGPKTEIPEDVKKKYTTRVPDWQWRMSFTYADESDD